MYPSGPDLSPDPGLESLLVALGATREMYTHDATWAAPRLGIAWQGRARILRGLLGEAAAMCDAELTLLARRGGGDRLISEYCVRFVYAGDGIEGLSLAAGDRFELERLHRRCAGSPCMPRMAPPGDAAHAATSDTALLDNRSMRPFP